MCPQPPGSGEGKDDLLLFLAASCSAALERPYWFSQSGRAPKHRESGLPGCRWRTPPWALELPVLEIEESKNDETLLLAASRRTFSGVSGPLQRVDCVERLPQVLLTVL